jgi:hypothetical protein
MGKNGKEAAGSSSAHGHETQKKRKTTDQSSSQPATGARRTPWKSGPLSDFPDDDQPAYFIDKMNTLINKKEGFICEKEVPDKQFGPFGVYNKFKALGWEAALKCYDGASKQLYMDKIEE